MKISILLFRNLTFFLFIFLVPTQSLGQVRVPTYHLKNFNKNNGLASEYNTYFLTDSKGFLWISSINGLNRFDGINNKLYQNIPNDTTSLFDNNIQSPLFEDKQGNLWFTTYEAIHCYRRNKDCFERYWIEQNGEKAIVDYSAFQLDNDGYLWVKIGDFNINQSIYKFDTKKTSKDKKKYQFVYEMSGFRHLVSQNIDSSYSVFSFISNPKYGFRIQTIKNDKQISSQYFFSGQNDDIFKKQITTRQVIQDKENKDFFWLGTNAGLVLFNKKALTYKSFDIYNGVKFSEILDIELWRHYIIVLTRVDGLLFFDKKTRQFISKIDFNASKNDDYDFCSSKYSYLFLDKNENLWLSSWDDACISHINLQKNKFYHLDSSIVNNSFSGIIFDKKGTALLLNTDYPKLISINPESFKIKVFESNREYGRTRSIQLDSQQNLWLFTKKGHLLTLENGKKNFNLKYFNNKIQLYRASFMNNKLLVSTDNGLQFFGEDDINNVNKKYVDETKILAYDFSVISQNQVLICDNDKNVSLAKYQNNKWEVEQKNIFKDVFNSCFKENNETIWVCGYKGLWRLKRNTKNIWEVENFLKNIVVVELVKINDDLWICSDDGLYFFNTKSQKTRKFTTADGLSGQIYTGIAKAPNGDIWLTHTKGVDIFNPNNMKPYMNPPQIQITGLKVNNTTYSKQGNVTEMTDIILPFSENTIELQFVAIEFADPENNLLKCRLDGIDAPDKWIDRKNTEGVMTYYKLPYGSYTFRIKAANADGIWTTTDKTFNITILPPWYLTWWAKLLWVLLFAGSVYAIIKVRERNIKRKADFAQKILKTEMQALRAQMNPHFLFNTLNSINAFVLKNDSKKASRFLTDFSHLIRKILDFSQKETISLEKEVEILRGYLDMEALRFDNSFDFDIEIDERLDEWETQVPTMILQPFIENAILHGIRHKKDGRGKIIIRFEPDGDDYFKCILQDNGVGRAKTAEINAQTRPKSHVSKGMQITQDRLDILNHQKGRTATLHIDDLMDENNNPKGTRVTIRIPTY